jgi:hypothetical protein
LDGSRDGARSDIGAHRRHKIGMPWKTPSSQAQTKPPRNGAGEIPLGSFPRVAFSFSTRLSLGFLGFLSLRQAKAEDGKWGYGRTKKFRSRNLSNAQAMRVDGRTPDSSSHASTIHKSHRRPCMRARTHRTASRREPRSGPRWEVSTETSGARIAEESREWEKQIGSFLFGPERLAQSH